MGSKARKPEGIRLTPDEESGALQVELFGELAALLALADEHLRGGSPGVQATPVAGARKQRCLQLDHGVV